MAISTQMIKQLREETGAGVLDCKKALETSGGNYDQAVEYVREKGLAAAAKKTSREANDGVIKVWVDDDGWRGVILEVNCETDFVARTEDFQGFVSAVREQIVQEPDVVDVPALLDRPYIEDNTITVGDRMSAIVAKLGENILVRGFARMDRTEAGWVEGYTHLADRIGVLLELSCNSDELASSAGFRELAHDLALQIAAIAPQYISPDDIPEAEAEAKQAYFQEQIAEDKKPDNIKEKIVIGRLGKWYEQICLLNQSFIKDDSVTVGDLIAQKSKEFGSPVAVEQFVRYELGAEK